MQRSWETRAEHLVCRWPEAGKHIPYNPLWMQEASASVDRTISPAIPNFAARSPLGSGEWFAPWNIRWSVPDR
jgi:hypothetical protein